VDHLAEGLSDSKAKTVGTARLHDETDAEHAAGLGRKGNWGNPWKSCMNAGFHGKLIYIHLYWLVVWNIFYFPIYWEQSTQSTTWGMD